MLSREIVSQAQTLWDYHCMEKVPARVDVLIALGSHDIRVAQQSAKLLMNGVAPLMVATGGPGNIKAGDWVGSEAEIYTRVCLAAGVRPEQILQETKSTSTTDNVVNSRRLLDAHGIQIQNAALVSKPYVARRAMAVATKQWPEVEWYVDYPRVSFENYPSDETPLVRMINLLVGDLQRIEGYVRKDLQPFHEVPEDVLEAYRGLVSSGFDEFVVRAEAGRPNTPNTPDSAG